MNNLELDIIMPVYNEGENILDALSALQKEVGTKFKATIIYDFDEDNTLPIVRENQKKFGFEINLLKNKYEGVHGAIMTGFAAATAPAIVVFPADEAYDANIIDSMYAEFKNGSDVVVASRFAKGGSMSGGPVFKSILVRLGSFILRNFVGLPASDATYGFRLVSKRIIDTIEIESVAGWTYAIEVLVKCDRLGWKVAEVPAQWMRREKGQSRFNLQKWFPLYFHWFKYALQTKYLKKGPESVKRKKI